MEKAIIDDSGISRLLDLVKSARQRTITRLYYAKDMSINEICDSLGYSAVIVVSDIAVINKLREDNIKHKPCNDCGREFYTNNNNRKCPICKENARKRRDLAQLELYKSARPTRAKKAKGKAFKSLQMIEKERAEYNKLHGTYLSYGQYVQLVGE